jgi:4-amino-4-deoxy-L-arabinose transferase-like glycosyltransferase
MIRKLGDMTGEEKSIAVAIAVLMGVGAYFRLTYLTTVSPHVDEYATLLAAQKIVEHGYPLLPSGSIYLPGVLFSYLDALFIYLFGFSEEVARLPNLLIGLSSIPLIYLLGKRMFSRGVGLLAAALLTFNPEAIVWSGRARMYALQQLAVILALRCFYEGFIGGDDDRRCSARSPDRPRYLFTLFFIAALLSQTTTVLLFPPLLLAILVRRGWRWFFKLDVLGPLFLSGVGVLATFIFNAVAKPLTSLQSFLAFWPILAKVNIYGPVVSAGERPFLEPYLGWGLKSSFFFREFFWLLPYLPLTLLFLLGFVYFLKPLLPSSSKQLLRRVADFQGQSAALIFCYGTFSGVMAEVFLLVGETWRRPRYLFLLLPIYFLLAAGTLAQGLAWLGRHLPRWEAWERRWEMRLVAWLLIAVIAGGCTLPAALAAATHPEPAYDQAFAYVKERWQEGDILMMILPAIGCVYLGDCDYYANQVTYREHLMIVDEVPVDHWTGSTLINSVGQLMQVLAENRRVWLLVDEGRFHQQYYPDFIRFVRQEMEAVYEGRGVIAFLAQDFSSPPIHRSQRANLADRIEFLGYQLDAVEVRPGEVVPFSLFWQAQQLLAENYSTFVHLVGRGDGFTWQEDGQPVGGLFPTSQWPVRVEVWDGREIAVPTDAPPGRYRLEVGWYDPSTLERLPVLDEEGRSQGNTLVLDYLKVVMGEESLCPQHSLAATFGDGISLLGYDLDMAVTGPGEVIHLKLYWQAREPVGEDYTVFVHLLGEDGQLWGQHDGQPEGGFYTTSFWDKGEVIVDEHEIVLSPDTPPGEYHLVTGLYRLATGERLAVDAGDRTAGDGRLLLGTVRVSEP